MIVSAILLTLGAFNAVLALTVETCTQGGAGSLGGGFITLILYAAGVRALAFSKPHPISFLALSLALPVAIWHSWFALRFAYGFYFQGMSACFAMQGGFTPEDRGEWMDGGEPMLIVLWLGLSAVFWVGVLLAFTRSIKRQRSSASV